MRCTGVAKSVTLSGCCSSAGNAALPISTTTVLPWVRRSGLAPAPLKCRISRPASPSPRLKSIFDTVSLAGACAAAAAAVGVGVAASAAPITAELPSSVANPNARSRTVAPRRMGRRLRALEKVIVLSP